MALPKEAEEQAEKNRRALLEVGSAALPLLLQSRNEAVSAGIKAGASLDSIAGRVQLATRQSITQARAISRASGVARLKSEAAQFGRAIIADPSWLSTEVVRDIERAKTYSKTYAERWLKKANEAAEKTSTVSKAAKVANTETIGSLKRTAVTESSEAFSSGRAKYLRRSDALGLLRVWDAGLDSCPICKAADGTIVGAREPFPIGEPGSVHANCCCSWTLLTSAADEQGTLIQPAPVRPVSVQVPGAASPFAPKGLVPSGGKLVASAETKALAKRLDAALGNVAKDGGAAARAEVRALLSQHGIKARSLGTGANAIKITDPADMGGMAGFHEWDGTIRLAPNTIRDSRAALRKIQLGVDPGDDHANALNVLLHEEIHGASAMSKAAYQGAGAALEEAATELAARRVTSQLMGREIGANYADEIAGLRRSIDKVSKTAGKKLDDAILALKSNAPLAQTSAQHINNLVDALKLTPKQRTALTKQLNETEWWKPGATAAKKPPAKPKAVKAVKPKAVAKPRAPPKIKDPQVQELLDRGFSGAVDTRGLRPESFAHLRSGGAVHGGTPILKIRADGTVDIVDGRHRITLARERGDTSIVARIMVEGPRGGIKQYAEQEVKLLQAGSGKQTVTARGSKATKANAAAEAKAAKAKAAAEARVEKARLAAEKKAAAAEAKRATAKATKAKPVDDAKARKLADAASDKQIRETLAKSGVTFEGDSEELRLFFGADKTPTADDLKSMLGLDSLSQLGKFKGEVRVDRFSITFRGSTEAAGASIQRGYYRNEAGEITAKHTSLFLSKAAQGKKLGSAIIREQVEAYERLGIHKVALDSAEIGRYYWPKIGFDAPGAFAKAQPNFEAWLKRNRIKNASEVAKTPRSMRELATLQVGDRKVGKEFLLSGDYRGDHLELRLDRNEPGFKLFRQEFGLEPKPAAKPVSATLSEAKQIGRADFDRSAKAFDDFLSNKPERAAFDLYTGEHYKRINGQLRDGKPMSAIAESIQDTLEQAHKKGLSIAGDVYRGTGMTNAQLAEMAAGAEVKIPGFLSTTIDRNRAVRYTLPDPGAKMPESRVVLKIRQQTAVPVDAISANKGEQELLMRHNTRFRVVSRTESKDHLGALTEVELEEIL